MTKIQQIVSEYRKIRGDGSPLPVRDFTDALKNNIPSLSDLTFQAVNNWETGVNEPALETLLHIFSTNDWRRDFAADLMAAKMPDNWLPQGEIGKRILGNQERGSKRAIAGGQ